MQNDIHKLKNKHVLVTGGAGFIGSNLCHYLVLNGVKVTCLDNLITGKLDNIKDLINQDGFTFLEGDITNIEDCNEACEKTDIILHQAALGSVPRSIENPINSNNVNINGFVNMLWAAKSNNIKRIIYAASSSTYGDSKAFPMSCKSPARFAAFGFKPSSEAIVAQRFATSLECCNKFCPYDERNFILPTIFISSGCKP